MHITTVLASLVALPLAWTSPLASPALSCGSTTAGHCANFTKAQAPCTYNETEEGFQCNWVQYNNWPNIATWTECKGTCQETKGCESFQYEQIAANSVENTAIACNLFFKPISAYDMKCKGGQGSPALYDVGCPTPFRNTTGKVPKHPSTAITNGTCNGALPWNGNQTQWAGIAYYSPPANLTQSACAKACNASHDCKSYFYSNTEVSDEVPRYQVNQVYPPNYNDYAVPQCILISQPVSEYTSPVVDFAENQFYDKNCPV